MNTLDEVIDIISQYSSIPKESITETHRLGEDLGIIGDDAGELLEYIAETFDIDMDGFVFSDYFPAEASAEMHYYSARRNYDRNNGRVVKLVYYLDKMLWGLFSKRSEYEPITVNDVYCAVKSGKWITNETETGSESMPVS